VVVGAVGEAECLKDGMVGDTPKHTRVGGTRCTGWCRWQHGGAEACSNRGVSELEVLMECEMGGKISAPWRRTSEDKVVKMGTQVATTWQNSASGWLPVAVRRCVGTDCSSVDYASTRRGQNVLAQAHALACDGKIWPGGPG
jgi:hypothetical protein